MRVVGNKELEEQDKELAIMNELEVAEETLDTDSVASYIMDCWEKAKRFKEDGAEVQIMKNMRQIDGEYEADKLAAIKEVGGSEVFMMITDAKCKNAKDWVNDIMFQSNQRPFGIQTTPVPTLPDDIQGDLEVELFKRTIREIAVSAPKLLSDPKRMKSIMEEALPELEEQVKLKILQEARKRAEIVEKHVDDKLIEGSWYEALRDTIKNVVMHTGILKGPVLKKRYVHKIITGSDGMLVSKATEEIIPTYESRHPMYLYPAPGSTDVNDGYLIDRIKVTPLKLQELIGVPGYNDEQVSLVLEEAGTGKLRNWLNLQVDMDLSDLNKETTMLAYDSDKIDCLEFWGYVYGEKLIEWGLTKNLDDKPIEKNKYHNVSAYLINTHVIKVALNTDPLGRKPFYRASFEEREGSFWGKGLPEIIADCQQTCNAAARAIVNNTAMGSGPQVERNIDRIPAAAREDNTVTPWKVWDVTDSMMASNSPAMRFYQPPMVVDRLMAVYQSFSKIADEHSGVPAFAHGNPQVGGAGNTASGLSMLMSSAARGIKALITTVDRNVIEPSVLRQYQMIVEEEENYGMVCDYNVTTLGSTAALIKEQLAQKRIEFMQATANPLDLEIIGKEGRKYLLQETAKSMHLDVERVFPIPMPTMPEPQQPPGQPGQAGAPNAAGEPVEKGQTLDAAGNPVVGQDTRQFNQQSNTQPNGRPPMRGGAAPRPLSRVTAIKPRAEGGDVDTESTYLVGEEGPELLQLDGSGSGQVIPLDNGSSNSNVIDINYLKAPATTTPTVTATPTLNDAVSSITGIDTTKVNASLPRPEIDEFRNTYDVGHATRGETYDAEHPSPFLRPTLTATEAWEDSDERTQAIINKAYEQANGNSAKAAEILHAFRRRNPQDLGLRNAEYYAFAQMQTDQGENPLWGELKKDIYVGLKTALPESLMRTQLEKYSTGMGGQNKWYTQGVKDASKGKYGKQK